jgi:hypothetical protein
MSVHVNFLLRFAAANLPAETLDEISSQMVMRTLARRSVARKDQPAKGWVSAGRPLAGVDFTLDGREVGFISSIPAIISANWRWPTDNRYRVVIALAKSEMLILPQDSARRLLFSTPAIAEQVVLRLATRYAPAP